MEATNDFASDIALAPEFMAAYRKHNSPTTK